MKIHFRSDTHQESSQIYEWPIPPLPTGADLVILGGDIDVGLTGVEWAITESERLNVPVLYVPGNHEFYYKDMTTLLLAMRQLTEGTGVHILDDDEFIYQDVRFLGSTLWTDYKAFSGATQQDAMAEARYSLNDHSVIKVDGAQFEPSDPLQKHEQSLKWLSEKLNENFNGKTVIVTHHGPSPSCQHRDNDMSAISACFHSNLDHLVKLADIWIYGHTHDNITAKIGDAQLLCNQGGYQREDLKDYDPEMLVDI